jgi:hypothetical protein
MGRVVSRATRKRGFFGWVFLLVFLAYNGLMLAWLIAYANVISNTQVHGAAAGAGKVIGANLGTGILLFFWVGGAVILGLLALLTRGSKTVIVEEIE